jgi:lysophospholipase L1-like esterase
MATKNVAIKGMNGLPLADTEAREMLKNANIINPFKGKKWAVFGDSISQPNADGLDKYYNYIADSLEMEVTSYAVGGSGYFKGSSVTGWGDNNIPYKIANASSDFDVISFFAGVNESSLAMGTIEDEVVDTPTTLCGAVKKSFEMAIEKYPNAQIFLITPTPGTGVNATPTRGNLHKFAENQIAIARMYNIPVIDLHHESGLRPWNSENCQKYYGGNYCHLVKAGHQYIAELIKKFMLNKLSI